MGTLRHMAKQVLLRLPVTRNYMYGMQLARKYQRNCGLKESIHYTMGHGKQLYAAPVRDSRAQQIAVLLRRVDICPVENASFFYSIDCYKSLVSGKRRFNNYTIDYSQVIGGFVMENRKRLEALDDGFAQEERIVLEALRSYLARCEDMPEITAKYRQQLDAIASLFERPAETLFEALQRILFINQFIWQTGHTLNGFGSLDRILDELYYHDLESGRLSRSGAKELIKDFFRALHEYYWFKSSSLMGDTGQIIILGGRTMDGSYFCNELTRLFIEVSAELRLPDPKVLLRCTADMPEELLALALDCISTGIGAPLLSNDDVVIQSLIGAGYDEVDAYRYATSACWEPLIPGDSCEQNNIASLNYAVPLVRLFDMTEFEQAASLEDVIQLYMQRLGNYIRKVLTPLTTLRFEPDPLLSLVSVSAMAVGKDVTQGGARYNSLGLTSVGMGTVVNSLLNLQRLVFEQRKYTLGELNAIRRANFDGQDALLRELKDAKPCFGCDDDEVISLTRRIMDYTSAEFTKYQTRLVGNFKFGLSSPAYINGAIDVAATFDGRRNGDPFSVHISSATALPPTELLSFAMKLDYGGNRFNGNVVDFFASPGTLQRNAKQYTQMIRTALKGGIFQLQMNVVDSSTLIAAKADPTLFPQLVVRVWGFSAYFNDLPDEYKDVLISRALESERAA